MSEKLGTTFSTLVGFILKIAVIGFGIAAAFYLVVFVTAWL